MGNLSHPEISSKAAGRTAIPSPGPCSRTTYIFISWSISNHTNSINQYWYNAFSTNWNASSGLTFIADRSDRYDSNLLLAHRSQSANVARERENAYQKVGED